MCGNAWRRAAAPGAGGPGRLLVASLQPEAAARIGAAMGWTDHQVSAELEAFEIERAAFLRKPARVQALLEAAAD